MPSPPIEYLLWFDIETDGADEPERGDILEVGAVLTTASGDDVIDIYESVVKVQYFAPETWPVVVREMHEKSGLLADIAAGRGKSLQAVEDELLAMLEERGVKPHRVAMAGSGVSHFDWRWTKYHMPRLIKKLRYWQLDTGHIRRFLDLSGFGYVVRNADTMDAKPHRGLADAQLHLSEMRYYQEQFGKAFAALIEQTRRQGMVVDNSLEPVEVAQADDRPEVHVPDGAPSVPEKWRSPER